MAVTVYDASGLYGKQNGSVSLSSTTPNVVTVSANQTNPYLSEQSTYTFLLNFTTPNTSTLLVTASTSTVVTSARCVLNCNTPSTISSGYVYSITSTYTVIEVTVTNAAEFNNSANRFTFTTEDTMGNRKDYG